jgi:hypothetical protein
MDVVIPFDLFPLFSLIGPLVAKARHRTDWLHHELFGIVDDYIQGRLGELITQEIGVALFSVVDSLARTIINSDNPDYDKLRILTEFCDWLKSQGVELKTAK